MSNQVRKVGGHSGTFPKKIKINFETRLSITNIFYYLSLRDHCLTHGLGIPVIAVYYGHSFGAMPQVVTAESHLKQDV